MPRFDLPVFSISQQRWRHFIAGCCLLLATALANADRIVLLVDNSGSMRMNDVERLVPMAVDKFISTLPADAEVAVVSFDARGRLIQPLIAAERFDASVLDQLSYRGPWTDLSLAVERSIYELRTPGRDGGRDAVVMITDGIMDTGSPEGDLRAESWLANDLSAQMQQRGITMWVVALTDEADFRILDPITRATGGSYHRAMTARDVGPAMERIREGIFQPADTTPRTEAQLAEAPPAVTPETVVPEMEPASTPPPANADGALAGSRLWAGIGLLLLGAGLLGWALQRAWHSRRPLTPPAITPLEYFPDCYLVDLHGVTHQSTHPLRGKYNMITRLQQPPDDGIHYIQIFRRQIGRRHALIEYRDFSFWIIDQQSVNGTFLNGKRVTTETRLKHGDRLKFYHYEFEYCVSDLALSNETFIAGDAHA